VWSLLLLAVTVWSFAHLLLGFSNRSEVVLWLGRKGGARCNLHKKNVWSVRFIAKGGDVVTTSQLTLRSKCDSPRTGYARRATQIYVAWTSNNGVTLSGDLYCCLLPQCEAAALAFQSQHKKDTSWSFACPIHENDRR